MIYILLLLAIAAPFFATYLVEKRLRRFHKWQAEQAAALHHFANSISHFGDALSEGLRRFGSNLPTSLTLLHRHQPVVPDILPGSDNEAIPADVVAYLSGWNEQWARDEELRYLRGLKTGLGSWEAALQTVLADESHRQGQD